MMSRPNHVPVINRARLIDRLTQLLQERRIVALVGPAGIGKTVLLYDFANGLEHFVCWLTLKPKHKSPADLAALIFEKLNNVVNLSPLPEHHPQKNDESSLVNLAHVTADIPIVVIIDSYNHASSSASAMWLARLVEQLPFLRIVLAARNDDSLTLPHAGIVSGGELRFTDEEIKRAVRKRTGKALDDNQAADLLAESSGNISHVFFLLAKSTSEVKIFMDSVYRQLPKGVRRLLRHMSVLAGVEVEEYRTLFGHTDHWLERVLEIDTLVSLKGDQLWYHHLWLDFLQARLFAEDDRETWCRLAGTLTDRGEYVQAISVYVRGQLWQQTAGILDEYGFVLYNTGHSARLIDWLNLVPDEEMRRNPRLLLLQGRILTNDFNRFSQALESFKRAQEVFGKNGDRIGEAEVQAWMSFTLRRLGDTGQAIRLSSTALSRLRELAVTDLRLPWAIRARGGALIDAGQMDAALTDLNSALALFEQLGDTYYTGITHHDLGVVYQKIGDLPGANYHFCQARQRWLETGNDNNLAITLNAIGVSKRLEGKYDESLALSRQSLDIAGRIDAVGRTAYALASIGDVYLDQGLLVEAKDAYLKSMNAGSGMALLILYDRVRLTEISVATDEHPSLLPYKVAPEALESRDNGFEAGLAEVLRGRSFLVNYEFAQAIELFSQAVNHFQRNDFVEEIKARLWLAFATLHTNKAQAARQVEAITTALSDKEMLWPAFRPTLTQVFPLLVYCCYRHRSSNREVLRGLLRLVTTDKVTIWGFGPPALSRGGRYYNLLELRGDTYRATEVLFLLLEARHPILWEDIGVILWPDDPPERVRQRVNRCIQRLRQLASPDLIVAKSSSYQINRDVVAWTDIDWWNDGKLLVGYQNRESRWINDWQERKGSPSVSLDLG